MASNTTDASRQRPFPFLRLPAELRDAVYDYLSGDEVAIASPEFEAFVSINYAPLQNVALVSRQISRDYLKRVAPRTTVILSDHHNFNFTLLPIPAKIVDVTKLELRMFGFCEAMCCRAINNACQAVSELKHTKALISQALMQARNGRRQLGLGLLEYCNVHMSSVTSVVVILGHCCESASPQHEWPFTTHNAEFTEELHKLAKSPKLFHLSVYRTGGQCLDATKIADEQRKLGGWQVESLRKASVTANETASGEVAAT